MQRLSQQAAAASGVPSKPAADWQEAAAHWQQVAAAWQKVATEQQAQLQGGSPGGRQLPSGAASPAALPVVPLAVEDAKQAVQSPVAGRTQLPAAAPEQPKVTTLAAPQRQLHGDEARCANAVQSVTAAAEQGREAAGSAAASSQQQQGSGKDEDDPKVLPCCPFAYSLQASADTHSLLHCVLPAESTVICCYTMHH